MRDNWKRGVKAVLPSIIFLVVLLGGLWFFAYPYLLRTFREAIGIP